MAGLNLPPLYAKEGGAAEKAGSALGVDIGSVLEFAIQAGDQRYFVFD